MKLSDGDGAVVDAARIRDYLLSSSHPVGRFKAGFFVALGYSVWGGERLAADPRRHALDNEALATQENEYEVGSRGQTARAQLL